MMGGKKAPSEGGVRAPIVICVNPPEEELDGAEPPQLTARTATRAAHTAANDIRRLIGLPPSMPFPPSRGHVDRPHAASCVGPHPPRPLAPADRLPARVVHDVPGGEVVDGEEARPPRDRLEAAGGEHARDGRQPGNVLLVHPGPELLLGALHRLLADRQQGAGALRAGQVGGGKDLPSGPELAAARQRAGAADQDHLHRFSPPRTPPAGRNAPAPAAGPSAAGRCSSRPAPAAAPRPRPASPWPLRTSR